MSDVRKKAKIAAIEQDIVSILTEGRGTFSKDIKLLMVTFRNNYLKWLQEERVVALREAEEEWDQMRKENVLWELPQDLLFDELLKRLSSGSKQE